MISLELAPAEEDRKLTPEEEFDMGLAILNSEEMRPFMPEGGWPESVICETCKCSRETLRRIIRNALEKCKTSTLTFTYQTRNPSHATN